MTMLKMAATRLRIGHGRDLPVKSKAQSKYEQGVDINN